MDRENMSLNEVVKSTLSLLLAIFIVASIISLSAGGSKQQHTAIRLPLLVRA